MDFNVIIKAEAHHDSIEAFNYYELQLTGLGYRFLEELTACYRQLQEHPFHYGFIDEDPGKVFRDIRVKKFPYVVVFEISNDEVIVYAVFNIHRDPSRKIVKIS